MADLWSDLQGTHSAGRVNWVVAGGLGGVCVLQMEVICKSRQAVGESTEKMGREGKKNSARGEIEAGPPWIRVGGFGIDGLRQFGLADRKKSVIRGRTDEQMEDGSR